MKKLIYKLAVGITIISGLSSCDGFLDRLPTDSVVAQNAMATLYDAGIVVNGLYTDLKYSTMYVS